MARALVTGSTSGLGLEFAWQLAGTGHDLVVVARNVERLEAVAAHLRDAHGVQVEVLGADLADRDALTAVEKRLTDPVSPVDLLVNNAGCGMQGKFLDISIEEHEHQMDTLMRAVLVLSHAAATAMVKRRRGAIINVSSLAGYTAAGAYAASKSWVTVFTEALATELRGTGVTATALLPGFVQTEFHERAAMNVDGLPRVSWLKAPFVVDTALRDAARGQVITIPSAKYRAAGEISRVAPRRLMRALAGADWDRRLRERTVRQAAQARSRSSFHAPWQGKDS